MRVLLIAFILSWSAATYGNSCLVTDLGAVGNNKTEDTKAIQEALDSCDTVIFPPPGIYLTRSLLISRNNQKIVIESGATVIAWPDPDTWVNGSKNVNNTPPIFSQPKTLVSGITITGGGKIDGQGWRWWPFMKSRSRPMTINLPNIEELLIDNITIIDSPLFNIQVRGTNIRIVNVTIHSNIESCSGYGAAPNTDGINIGGKNIYVADCFIHNGDDCIPTNAGPGGISSNILVERVHCECGTNSGVPIIASSTTVRDVIYQDFTIFSLNQGAGMKISEPYDNATGQVINVTWRRMTIKKPRNTGLYTDVFEEDATHCVLPSDPSRPHWLTAIDLTFEDITVIDLPEKKPAGCFLCSPSRPCTGFLFKNITISGSNNTKASPYICMNSNENSHWVDCDPPACGTNPFEKIQLGS